MSAVKSPPGPKGSPIFGSALAFRRDPLNFLVSLSKYGDVARFRAARYDAYLLSHPDYVRELLVTQNRAVVQGRGHHRAKEMLGEGLLTSEGETHRRQRRLEQPAFHRQRIAGYASVMAEHGARLSAKWKDGDTVDAAQEMMRVTLSIVGETLFGTDIESNADEIGESLTVFLDWWRILMLPYTEMVEWMPLPGKRRFHQTKERFDRFIYALIDERRNDAREGRDRGDLLSMLVRAQDMEGDGGQMTDLQLRDEAVTLMVAGHETTANALAWTWYLLSDRPDVEAKLHAEVDAVLDGRMPAFEDLSRLEFTEKVFTEAMRMYPPAWGIGRRVVTDLTVGGYVIPPGSLTFVSQYVTHHDGRWFPEPYTFNPDRWTPEMKAALPKFAYFPFGGGPRQCIGEGFAWMEGVLLLAQLSRHWRLRLVPGHPVELKTSITLRPKHGLKMRLERR